MRNYFIKGYITTAFCVIYKYKLNYTKDCCDILFIFLWLCSPARGMAPSFMSFLDHTQRRATVGSAPLDE
jgi:hypothetical protein